MTTKKATRAMWLEEALNILDREGAAALTIDRLCRGMQKSKGGFYHHFGDAEGLRLAILDHWEATHTSAIIEAAEVAPPSRKEKVLDAMASAANWGHERAIRRWAWADEGVRNRVSQVDERRIEYLMQFYSEVSPKRARELSTLEYAALVGAQHLFGVVANDKGLALGALLRRALCQVRD